MSLNSKIEWTEATWNPVTGCTKISEGCKHCYAATLSKRLKAMGNCRYVNGFEVTIHEDLIDKPLHWEKGKHIFVNSMSDIFHESIDDNTIIRIFETMNKADWHIFQVLTKRAERLVELSHRIKWTDNIWMGVTVENNHMIERCNLLKKTGARIKFVSAEPLLGAIPDIDLEGINWLIVGGESGPYARAMKEEWVLELKEKARKNNTAFFFKQWGGTNKKKTGNLLQGKVIQEYPII